MKKINYLLIILSIAFGSLNAQQNVADFENLTLSSESYWDGSDLSGTNISILYLAVFFFWRLSIPQCLRYYLWSCIWLLVFWMELF